MGKEGGECEIFFALLLRQRYFEIKYLLPLHRQWRSSGSRHTYIYGVLAHLARARHWQCRGERFESAILHAGLRVLPAPCLYNTAKAHRRLPNEKKALNDASQRVDNGRNPLRSR